MWNRGEPTGEVTGGPGRGDKHPGLRGGAASKRGMGCRVGWDVKCLITAEVWLWSLNSCANKQRLVNADLTGMKGPAEKSGRVENYDCMMAGQTHIQKTTSERESPRG